MKRFYEKYQHYRDVSNAIKKAQNKDFVKVLVLVLVFFAILAPLSSKQIRVGITQNLPKMFWDSQDKPAGIFIDILNIIADTEGWEIVYHKDTWENCIQLVKAGELDLLPDVAHSSEREKYMDFHQIPVLFSWTQLYARKGLNIGSLEELAGKKIAVLSGSIQESTIKDMISGFSLKSELLGAPSFNEVLALVQDGKADVAATNYYFGRMHAHQYNLEETDIMFEPSTLFFATPKGKNRDLLLAIDKHLGTLKKRPDTAYYEILHKYSANPHEFQLPLRLLWGGIFLLFALILSVSAVIIFKKQVNKRTAELRKINREMELRIEERTEELALAMHKAQVADMMKSAFLATMSHELRTPLNSVIGFTGILLKELPGAINEEQKKMLSIVQGSARHLLALINDVLDISKIEAGQLEMHYSDVELQVLLEQVVEVVAPQAATKGLELSIRTGKSPKFIHVDERRFEQVLLNLLSNAIKFCERGEIQLSFSKQGSKLILEVKDTGIGIPDEMQDKIFHPFVQVDMGIDRKYEGTGLGLFISKRIIEMMGGDIILESEVNVGSTFSVILPLQNEDTSQ
ncbi:MAG: ATP-binding protein [Candidatus Cloacimonetes bacterium]|jgi:signal transduction histidine kinase|nr:transporter substrate-binding domain-containing protein [Candidatus Cloacimonadota bacterium]MDY0298983.1 ATP-binding protein [Candidatus Cloacimonadaceae bacterium]MCB5278609.1 transporter substrate-binding domain-containing protein [Candidatus Cloacimonadota bacterium]MCK9331999.1 ATP-binding protein [Candidatus Cloacimonadota bacterium]MDD2210348.1 ATP-binding protein [Candidatus Cloacimonadota bacterium]